MGRERGGGNWRVEGGREKGKGRGVLGFGLFNCIINV